MSEALLDIVADACWIWPKTNSEGYGNCRNGLAHRRAWEAFRGQIPKGLQIDHLCRNRACVNPAHLELVTRKVNILRGVSPHAINARKTHCPQGHRYDLSYKNGRYCRQCRRAAHRRWWKTIKACRKCRRKMRADVERETSRPIWVCGACNRTVARSAALATPPAPMEPAP